MEVKEAHEERKRVKLGRNEEKPDLEVKEAHAGEKENIIKKKIERSITITGVFI